jgi:multidrug efflux pump subunit AcrA (membrane-fusion protein)
VDGSGPGCEAASDRAGNGPIAKLKETEFGQAQQKYQGLNSQLRTAQHQLTKAQSSAEKASGSTLKQQQSAAEAALPGLQTQYNNLEAQLKQNETQAQNAVQGNNGILAQLQDLAAAGAKNPMLSVAQWVVTLLFFCIEILPVMVKVLLNIGPLSTYETLLKNEEEIITDQAKLARVTRRRDAEREADKRIAIDEHMRQLEEDLGKKANVHVAKHMETILDLALAEWSRQVQAKLGVIVPRGPAVGGTPVTTTGPQPRLGITGPQPILGANGGHVSGSGRHGQAPTVGYLTPPGSGYSLPDDEDLL